MNRIRVLACLLALAMCLAPGALAQEDKPVITIARAVNTLIEDLETNAMTLMLEAQFDIDIQYMEFPSDDADAKLAVLINSGSELPDVINIPLNQTVVYNYGSKGVFLPLNEYFADKDNLNNLYTRTDDAGVSALLGSITMPDGKVYSIPSYYENSWNQQPYRMWINKEWLDALDLEMPATTDEFKDVLEAFATRDPNNNGVNDEIPLMGSTGGYGQNVIPFLLNAFCDANITYNYFAVKDETVYASFITDEFKAGLEYLRELTEAGLLYEGSFTQDQTQMRAIINQDGDYVVGCLTSGSYGHWTGAEFNVNFQKMALLAPLTGPDGECYVPTQKSIISQKWFITRDCANPDLAFKLGEYCYDYIISMSDRFGVYGTHWTDDPEVLVDYSGSYESIGIPAKCAVIENVWNVMQNYHLYEGLPFYKDMLLSMSIAEIPRTPENSAEGYEHVHATHYRTYWDKASDEILGTLNYSEAETEILSEVKSEIDSYVKESIAAFITGKRDLGDWDAYVKELENIGLEDYVSVLQAAYERTL